MHQCNVTYHYQPTNQLADDLEPTIKRIAQAIYDGKMSIGDVDETLIDKIAEDLLKGVDIGWDLNTDSDINGVKDRLDLNTFVFSGAKTYQQVKDMSQLLLDDQGQVKPFKQFLSDVLSLNKQYNKHYLLAEYNHAIASSQMASQWQEIWATRQELPYLRYETAGDDRVRVSHQALDQITKPVEDPFWDTYYPPNGWNCRCDVIQTSRPGDDTDPIDTDPVEPMFRYNVGKHGVIFPERHPMFQMPEDEKVRMFDVIAPLFTPHLDNYYEYLQQKISGFKDYGFDRVSGGFVIGMPGEERISLKRHELIAWQKLKRSGSAITILAKSKTRGGDAMIQGVRYELKSLVDRNSGWQKYISSKIEKGAKQADHVILDIQTEIEPSDAVAVLSGINGAFKKSVNLKEVWIMVDSKMVKVSRSDLENKDLIKLLSQVFKN